MSESATKVSTPPADDVEALLLELWRGRSDAAKISSICERLIQVAPTDLEKVEMYLPQFAHLVIALHVVLPTVAPIERFLLTVCQLSIHIALQFFWLVYAALQENRIKLGKDRDAYRNCARLLLQLEQCVVYGGGGALAGVAATATTANELMQECVRVASESQSSSVHAPGEHVVHSGLLRKQGGGTSRFGRKTWHERYFEVRDRVLYYYSSQANAVADKTSPSDRPRGSMQLTTAIVSCPKNEDRPNYFEVRCRQSGLKFCLEAPTKDVMGKWILTIQAVTALPEPPGMQPKDVQKVFSSIFETAASDSVSNDKLSELSDKISDEYIGSKAFTALAKSGRTPSVEVAQTGAAPSSAESKTAGREVYAYFDSQREFVRTLTNLAEELRYLQPEERQAALQPRLDAIAMPPGTYFPLAHSSEKCARLLRFTPNESVVFNTKARCPIMLLCEVAREPYTLAEIHKHIGTNAEPVDSAAVDVQLAVTDGPTLAEKKREAWVAKSSRLKQTSTLASKVPGWELTSFIVKSNDDLRQEVFIMQMIRYFDSIWPAELCWLNTYHIEATGPDTGLIETITASSDLDRLKRQEGYKSLRQLFVERHGPPDSEGFLAAQDNFVKSLAAYSVVMWILKLRDRHNGNLMLDEAGHYFHIDFGFCLGHSTGKGIGGAVECSNFKLTEEYIELLDGRNSPVFERYCAGCVAAMQAAHEHAPTILSMVEIVGTRSGFPCFGVYPVTTVIPALAQRLLTHKPAAAVEDETRKLIYKAAGHWGSRNYDWFQMKQRGIRP